MIIPDHPGVTDDRYCTKYKQGQGVTSAPEGLANVLEPVITFVRDNVAQPGHKWQKNSLICSKVLLYPDQ